MPIEHINKTDTLNEGREKLNNAITAFNETVVEGDSSVEAAQARVDEKGVPHPTLKARIDDGMNSVNQQLAEEAQRREQEIRSVEEELSISINNVSTDLQNGLNSKVGKGENESITWDMADQHFKEQITGGNTAVVGENSVNTTNIVNRAVTSEKSSFLGRRIGIITPENKVDIIVNGNEKAINFSNGTVLFSAKDRYVFDGEYKLSLNKSNNHHYIFFNFSTNIFNVITTSAHLYNLDENDAYVGTISFTGNDIKSTDFSFEYSTNGVDESLLNATYRLFFGNPYKHPNFDLTENRIELYGFTAISWENETHYLNEDAESTTVIDYASEWGDGSTTPIIYFDTKSKEFVVYKSSDSRNVPKSCIWFCTIYKKGSSKEFNGIAANFPYTINGRSQSESSGGEDKPYLTIPEKLTGWFESDEVDSHESSGRVPSNLELEDVYNKFEELSTDHSNYLTMTNLGDDESSTHSVYRLDFKPLRAVTSAFEKELPKMILFIGVHGSEKASVISFMNFAEQLCGKWKESSFLEYLRWNIHLIVIPVVNPWGFVEHMRTNSNDVDLNRNSSYRWNDYGGSDKGTAPWSELEAQYMRDIINENTDAMAMIDYHTNGTSGEEWDVSFWHQLGSSTSFPEFDKLNEFAIYNIGNITNESHKRFEVDENSGLLGFVSYASGNTPFIASYASSQGIPSLTLECTRKLVDEDVNYSARSLKLNTEYIGNSLGNLVKTFNG